MYADLALIAAFVFLYSLVSGRQQQKLFSGALVFVAFGLAFGPLGLDLISFNVEAEGLRTLAELALAFVLFTDSSNANLRELKHSWQIPLRLLLLGLPLTIALGYAFGVLIFNQLTLLEIAIIATMLAPTDAALGQAVVSNTAVPANIREGLNVESGLNDGICVPVLLIFLSLATNKEADNGTSMLALELMSEAIGIGVLVGVGLTLAAVRLLAFCASREWINETWQQLLVPALALACFALAQWLGGSGFIACFVGGLLFGGLEKRHKYQFLLAAEGTGDTLALITWVAFGAGVVGHSLAIFSWDVLVYALLSLTVIRMLPVYLVLWGAGLSHREKLFMGWFGPRGLASIVFVVIVLGENPAGASTLSATVFYTVILSVIAHGLSANPLIKKLAAGLSRQQ
jgi:NhaP-type Na+/H+ or K+/H+ antiporter